ncbi:EamA family transporter [Bacillaceae bacterium]
MWFLVSLMSALLFGLAGFFMKMSSYYKGSLVHLLFGLYFTGTLGFAIWASLKAEWVIRPSLWLGGWIVGLGSALGNYLFMKALDAGPASLTSPLVNLNIVLVVLMSVVYYDETLKVQEGIAVLLLIASVLLLPVDPNESLKIRNKKWYGFVLLAILVFSLRNGGLKVTEELNLDNTLVLLLGYLFSLVWSAFPLVMRNHLERAGIRKGLWLGFTAGVFSFAGMQLYAYALKIGPASIVSPIFSTNSLVVAILSIAFFKERLSLFQGIALLLLFCGLILLKST